MITIKQQHIKQSGISSQANQEKDKLGLYPDRHLEIYLMTTICIFWFIPIFRKYKLISSTI